MEDFDNWLFSLQLSQRPIKRSVTIAGHATSISLEPVFWDGLQALAREPKCLAGQHRFGHRQGAR